VDRGGSRQGRKTLGLMETIDPVSVFAIADPMPPKRNGQKVLLDLAHSQSHIHGWAGLMRPNR